MALTFDGAIQRVADLEKALDNAQDEIAALKKERAEWIAETKDEFIAMCKKVSRMMPKWNGISTEPHQDTYIAPYIDIQRRVIQAACDWAWRRDYAYMDNGADELIAAVHAYNELVGKGDEK